MKPVLLLLFMLLFSITYAQDPDRIKPGKLYHEGEAIVSPKYGFSGEVPEGWAGMLPTGTEIFSLYREDGKSGEVFLFAYENNDINSLKSAWENGVPLTDAIFIRAEDMTVEDQMVYGEVIAEGEHIDEKHKFFIIGKCGAFGPCVSMLMLAPELFYEQNRDDMLELMKEGTFVEPFQASPYLDFDWRRFLSSKMLVAYEVHQDAKRQNQVILCVDGTFTAKVQRSGWLRQEGEKYKGRYKGTWSVSGTGPETVLTLNFSKKGVDPLQVQLGIEEEKVYANGDRYFVGYATQCD